MTSSWYPGEYAQPYYPRFFKVVDLAPSHLSGDRRAYWRKCRDAGLGMWKPGATFRVTEGGTGYVAGTITIDVAQTQDGTAGQADFGRLPPDSSVTSPGIAWAHIDPEWFEQQYLSNVGASLKRVVAHEVGHCLGFGHSPPGSTGVMSADPQGGVNAEERAAVAAYWRT